MNVSSPSVNQSAGRRVPRIGEAIEQLGEFALERAWLSMRSRYAAPRRRSSRELGTACSTYFMFFFCTCHVGSLHNVQSAP